MKLLDSMRGMYAILLGRSLGRLIGLNLREATRSGTSEEKRVMFCSFPRTSTDAGSSQGGDDRFLLGHHSLTTRLLQRAIFFSSLVFFARIKKEKYKYIIL